MNHTESKRLFTQSKKVIPGGVNSPVRAFKGIDQNPIMIESAMGSHLYDVDGNTYIDYVMSWGPLILGHSDQEIVETLKEAVSRGTSYGAPTELEFELAQLIVNAVPSIDKVRMVNSGTEAVMTAMRLARGYTARDKIIKIVGCYHGHSDSLLVDAGSGPATLATPGSPGVPASFAEETITVPFNDIAAINDSFEKYGEDIAALILEPIPANMGVILPQEGYLKSLRKICDKYNSLLIFDEVITGFRVAYGGAQEIYNVRPDITCLGKIIGGGLPVGAYGGKKEIMDYIAPDGPVYQAGTLSGNPLAMTAGTVTLKRLSEENTYQHLKEKTEYLVDNLKKIAENSGIKVNFNSITGLFTRFLSTDKLPTNYREAASADRELFNKFFLEMLNKGIYLAPSPFEAAFLSLAHEKDDLDRTIEVYREVINNMA
ncbi:MAG: glutamate-1-semialdehyde-2,1-aminomutase [Firmicutes bacterium]|nr:glutamate-1-semialdehyde-2,1-aminomutase [Bacillota bacterium]